MLRYYSLGTHQTIKFMPWRSLRRSTSSKSTKKKTLWPRRASSLNCNTLSLLGSKSASRTSTSSTLSSSTAPVVNFLGCFRSRINFLRNRQNSIQPKYSSPLKPFTQKTSSTESIKLLTQPQTLKCSAWQERLYQVNRLWTVENSSLWGLEGPNRMRDSRIPGSRSHKAVSYTHLTLPTILLV